MNEELRQLQLCELDILKKVVDVCDRNNIDYWLYAGTLLGAVRHGGFIPWDDDIDIMMPIYDYKKFLKIAQDELGDQFFVQTYLTDAEYCYGFSKVRKNNTTMLDLYHKHWHIHHGVWIDIFPVIPINEKRIGLTKLLVKAANMTQMGGTLRAHEKEFLDILGNKKYKMALLFNRLPLHFRQNLHSLLLNIVCCGNPKSAKAAILWGNITDVFPSSFYKEEAEVVNFEGVKFKAPHNYEKWLELEYGDYMTPPPPEKRGSHNCIIDLNNSYEKYMEK